MGEDAPAQEAGPTLVRAIDPAVLEEILSPVEQSYFILAKAEADRALQIALQLIIKGHGHDSADGRRYDFTDDGRGTLCLRIAST